MTDGNSEMELDSHPGVLPQSFEDSWKRDLLGLRETFTQTIDQILGTTRQTRREEIMGAIPPKPNEEKDRVSEEKIEDLNNEINELKEQVARKTLAISDRDAKNKRLQQVIIENSQQDTPPVDEEVVRLFNDLKNDVMKTVKKHFTRPLLRFADNRANWKEYEHLSAENQELWVRSRIADDLYTRLFFKKTKIYGLDPGREDAMRNFETLLEESGKVSEADITDWRIRTVSLVRKLDPSLSLQRSATEAYSTFDVLRPIITSSRADAHNAMVALFHSASKIAMLLRSTTVSYSWLQKKPRATILIAESEIIGSINPNYPAGQAKLWKMVFGGVVKNNDSEEEDNVVLSKSEILVE